MENEAPEPGPHGPPRHRCRSQRSLQPSPSPALLHPSPPRRCSLPCCPRVTAALLPLRAVCHAASSPSRDDVASAVACAALSSPENAGAVCPPLALALSPHSLEGPTRGPPGRARTASPARGLSPWEVAVTASGGSGRDRFGGLRRAHPALSVGSQAGLTCRFVRKLPASPPPHRWRDPRNPWACWGARPASRHAAWSASSILECSAGVQGRLMAVLRCLFPMLPFPFVIITQAHLLHAGPRDHAFHGKEQRPGGLPLHPYSLLAGVLHCLHLCEVREQRLHLSRSPSGRAGKRAEGCQPRAWHRRA